MGFLATAAAVATAAGSAYSAYSASQGQQAQAAMLARLPQLKKLELESLDSIFREFLGQEKQVADLSLFADALNEDYQNRLQKVAPNLLSSLSQFDQNTSNLLQGILPDDVNQNIQRLAAEQSILGGYGATSGMGRNLVARDLGLTTLQLQQQGASNLSDIANLSRFLNPADPQEWLFSPSALMTRSDQLAQYNNEITNINRDRKAMAGTPYNPPNPMFSGVVGGLSSIASNFLPGGALYQSSSQQQQQQAPSLLNPQGATSNNWRASAWGVGPYNPYV